MKAILEQQESEFEESAEKDRITRLVSRLKERDRKLAQQHKQSLMRLGD